MDETDQELGHCASRQVLEELRIEEQFGDLVRRESWPELGSISEPGEHIEHALAEDVDEQQARHRQELGSPGRAKLKRDPESECGGGAGINDHCQNQQRELRAD